MPPRTGPPHKQRERPPARTGALVSRNQKYNEPANRPLSRSAQAAPIGIRRDLQFRRDVVRLYELGPRAVYELLAEVGARRLCRTEIEGLAAYYAQLDPETARAVGADQLPPRPTLRLVRP